MSETRPADQSAESCRLLIVDDNPSIHTDIRKILATEEKVAALEVDMFDDAEPAAPSSDVSYQIDSALQGQEGLVLLRKAIADGRPYGVAFVDMRMPPGWDGIETIKHFWEESPDLQVVICTAFSDHSWSEIVAQLEPRDRLLILRKPFDTVEIQQLAHSLSAKWGMRKQIEQQMADLERVVDERTGELVDANRSLQAEGEQRARLEVELRLAHKLEAVGQLASGIAHELNTPIQFVGDSVEFLKEASTTMLEVVDGYRALVQRMDARRGDGDGMEEATRLETAADLDYLKGQIPASVERIFDGTNRIATIVRAMKEFAHPGDGEKSYADLNKAIANTLTVAGNEYKYVADIDLALAELPMVSCRIGEVNQVLLNMIVNAAHAVEAVVGNSGVKGRIGIRTRVDGPDVVIDISDTGCGIAKSISSKVYDPFFTTKPVGKGTGQGLAIVHSIIVDKHGGSVDFTSEVGQGTTFVIRLPIASESVPPAAA
jgi:two-component system, NtrC family, sensor kinase